MLVLELLFTSRTPLSLHSAEYGRTFREVPLDASGRLAYGRLVKVLLRAGPVTGPELITVDR